jgi:hypothetical protein
MEGFFLPPALALADRPHVLAVHRDHPTSTDPTRITLLAETYDENDH